MFGYYVQQPSLYHDVNRTLRWPINYCIYLRHRLRLLPHERVPIMGVWTSLGSKLGLSKEIVCECQYSGIYKYVPLCRSELVSCRNIILSGKNNILRNCYKILNWFMKSFVPYKCANLLRQICLNLPRPYHLVKNLSALTKKQPMN